MKERKNTGENWPDILRRAALESGKTCYRLATDAGIGETRLRRFLQGTSGLSLKYAERLASVLGLLLVRRP